MRTYVELAANIAAIEKLGMWIATSQMFGTTNPAQACIIAADLFITNQPLMDYQKRNDMLHGKPSKPYDAMIAEFQEAGGKIKVIEKSPECAHIELTFDGNSKEFKFTWEEAQKEPLPYQVTKELTEAKIIDMLARGEKPPLKAKYATPRSRAIMLFARVASDGIRTVAARVNFGMYTPEEIEDFSENATVQPVVGAAAPSSVSAPAATAPAPAATTSPTGPYAMPDKATAVPLSDNPPVYKEAIEIDPRTQIKLNEPAQDHQKNRIINQMGILAQEGQTDIKDKVVAKLKASGIEGGLLGLTVGEADALLAALQQKSIENWASSILTGHKAANQGNA
jgi:hypothetical protein